MKKILVFTAMSAVLATSANASYIYGLATTGIYKIDTASGVSTVVHSITAGADVNGLAYDGNKFYYSEAGVLYQNNGTQSVLATTGFSGNANGNATYYNGKYWFASNSNGVQSVDLSTGVTSGNIGVPGLANGYGDIVSDSTGKVWAQSSGASRMQTFSLNSPGAGATTLALGGKSSLQLAFADDGALWGVSFTTGQLFQVNTATGARTAGATATYLGNTLGITDAASANAPVPEPASMLALGLGAAGLFRRRFRKA